MRARAILAVAILVEVALVVFFAPVKAQDALPHKGVEVKAPATPR